MTMNRNKLNVPKDLKLTNLTCRICLQNVYQGKSLFAPLAPAQKLNSQHNTFADTLRELTNDPILQYDDFPHLICKECIKSLHTMYQFKEKFKESQRIIKALAASKSYNNNLNKNLKAENANKSQNTKLSDGLYSIKFCENEKSPSPVPLFECKQEPDDDDLIVPTVQSEELENKETEENLQIICKYLTCAKVFTSYAERKAHYISAHRRRPKLCAICGKSFINLSSHMQTHRELNTHKCPHCSKAFKVRRNLIQHIVIHTSQKPYGCSFCGKRFIYKHHLLKHEQVHTEAEEAVTASHICKTCMNIYSDELQLKKHMLNCHHKDDEEC